MYFLELDMVARPVNTPRLRTVILMCTSQLYFDFLLCIPPISIADCGKSLSHEDKQKRIRLDALLFVFVAQLLLRRWHSACHRERLANDITRFGAGKKHVCRS